MPIAHNSPDSNCSKFFRLPRICQIPIAPKCPYSDCPNSDGAELLWFRLPRFRIAPDSDWPELFQLRLARIIPIPISLNPTAPIQICPESDCPKITLIPIVPLPLPLIAKILTSDCPELPRFPPPIISPIPMAPILIVQNQLTQILIAPSCPESDSPELPCFRFSQFRLSRIGPSGVTVKQSTTKSDCCWTSGCIQSSGQNRHKAWLLLN